MSIKIFVSTFFGWFGGAWMGHLMAGTWFGATEATLVNVLSVFKIFWLGPIPVPYVNLSFFTVGLPALIGQWERFPFLEEGTGMLIFGIYGLLNFSALICFLILCVGIVQSFFRR